VNRPLKIFVHGHYNNGNVGDEALLASVVLALAQRLPGQSLEVSFVSSKRLELPEVENVTYHHISDQLSSELWAAWRASLLVFGGGSQFMDFGQVRRVRYLLKPLLLACLAPRVIGLGLSLGPVSTIPGRWLTRWTLRRMRVAQVRDLASVELANRLGVQVIPGDDLVFSLPLSGFLSEANPTESVRQPGLELLVSLVSFSAQLSTVAEEEEALCNLNAVFVRLREHWPDLRLRGMDFEPGLETASLIRVLAGFGSEPLLSGSVGTLLKGIRGADLVLATRLHSMVFAVLLGRPVLAIEYHPKVRALADQLGLPPEALMPLETLTQPDLLYARLNAFLRSPETYKPARTPAELQQRASETLQTLLSRVFTSFGWVGAAQNPVTPRERPARR